MLRQSAITSKQQRAAIYVGIGKMLFLMSRGAAYECQLAQLDDDIAKTSGNLEASLIKLYVRLLDFLAAALLLQDKNKLGRVVYALWTPGDIMSFSEDCIELESTLDIESRLIERKCNKKMSENVKALFNTTGFLEKMATDTKALLLALRVEEQEIKDNADALDWVSKLPVWDHHADAKAGRALGTGQWVFRKPEFIKWDESSKASFLWIHGIRK